MYILQFVDKCSYQPFHHIQTETKTSGCLRVAFSLLISVVYNDYIIVNLYCIVSVGVVIYNCTCACTFDY